MRLRERRYLSYSETVIEFSQTEQRALMKAAEIADAARELARTVQPDFEDDSQDTLLAEIEHNAREYATCGEVPVIERDDWLGPIDFQTSRS